MIKKMKSKPDPVPLDKTTILLEEFGKDDRFLGSLGLFWKSGSSYKRKRTSLKVYIPQADLDLFQVLAIYLKLKQTSISRQTREMVKEFAKSLIKNNDPLFEQAKLIHRELRQQSILKRIGAENE